jgi:hypothetical protein
MASDLVGGCAVVAALAALLFAAALAGTRRLSPPTLNLLAVLIVASLVYYIQVVWYNAALARWLPVASLIVVGNWLPLFAALLAAIAWRRAAGSPLRQGVQLAALLLIGCYALLHPLLGSPPACGNRWDKLGTCLQTTKLTCSPACAATLLSRYGIEASEQEMAELCLTRYGTSWQGLYRGLKLKTAGTEWDVEIVRCRSDELRQIARGPMILSVGLEAGLPADTDFTRELGWVPGVNHSVVLTGFSRDGLATIADPSIEMSREQWDCHTLAALWRGYAIRLVPRQSGDVSPHKS